MEVLHTRLRLHLVPKGPVLVRTQKLLLIAVGVSVFKLFLALIHLPLNPPQLIEKREKEKYFLYTYDVITWEK